MNKSKAVGIQYAALPFRHSGRRLEILLITSRETRRWVIPKGWPVKGLAPQEAAALEAAEEAGLEGEIEANPIGSYRYLKHLKGGHTIPIQVIVFPRALVAEPNLKRLIRDFGLARAQGLLPRAAHFGRWIDAALFGLHR